jgi:hypothetical protein
MKDTCVKDSELKVNLTAQDLPKVITLQNIIRGYLDRKKSVEFSNLRFATANKRKNKTELKK